MAQPAPAFASTLDTNLFRFNIDIDQTNDANCFVDRATDTRVTLAPKAQASFDKANTALNALATTDANGVKTYTSNKVGDRNQALYNVNKYLTQGITILRAINDLTLADKNSGNLPSTTDIIQGGKNKKNRKQKGGAVPDLVNSVTAFQNVGGLLATASPLDNANRMEPAVYNAGSFNAGLLMPVSSSSGLPSNYRIAMDQPLQTGGKAKKNKNKSKQ